jgi:hypothetical protein
VERAWSVVEGDGRRRHRALALLAVLVLALGAVACGDDGDGGDSPNAQGGDGETTAVDNSPEGQIRSTYASFVDTFYGKDATAVCESLTASARKRVGRDHQGCEKRFQTLFDSTTLGRNKPYVVHLRVDGPRALALVKTKTSNRYPVPFQKENGEWKLDGGWGGG